jgi:hypothetical protein
MKPVTVVGGGIAGCTVALELSKDKKCFINLYEKKSFILENAPYCRLHCGLMYPMISFKESELLLKYSIEFAKEYPTAILKRPCVIMYNSQSNYKTVDLVNKCNFIKLKYTGLSSEDLPLGNSNTFFAMYTKNDVIHLKNTGEFLYSTCEARKFHDPYVKKVCKMLKDINSIKYPFVSVNEFGIEQDIVEKLIKNKIHSSSNIKLHLETEYLCQDTNTTVINAKGHLTLNNGLLELKSSWLIRSLSGLSACPEIAIIGERGTSQGMIQLSPRKNGEIQLHYMSLDSTLFQRVTKFSEFTLQNQKIITNNCIPDDITITRTNNAIKQINKILYTNLSSNDCKALWGCQFIPDKIDTLRTSTYTLKKKTQKLEVDIQIVKAISSVYTAKKISLLVF